MVAAVRRSLEIRHTAVVHACREAAVAAIVQGGYL